MTKRAEVHVNHACGTQMHDGSMSCHVRSCRTGSQLDRTMFQFISVAYFPCRCPAYEVTISNIFMIDGSFVFFILTNSGTVKREIQELFAPCSGESAPGAPVIGFLPLSKGGQGGEAAGRHFRRPQIVPRLHLARFKAFHTTPL
jgi:hypothetical protein